MTTLTIRLNEEEKEIFQAYASFQGKPLSTLMRDVFNEYLEQEIDKKLLKEAIAIKKQNNRTISFEELESNILNENTEI